MKRMRHDRCADDGPRRAALRATALNGIDYVEVDEADRHRLTVYFIAKLGDLAKSLKAANFAVVGGRRVRDIRVVDIEVHRGDGRDRDDCVVLTVDTSGDFSPYMLCVVSATDGQPSDHAHPHFDPVYACVDFTFQAGCPSNLDCAVTAVCPSPADAQPAFGYLAKDYASFRQLMLDRLSIVLPQWKERHEPDLLLALVELLAYEGDRLSYLQDAVATEAYLDTARQRISVRRHARLVDYRMHEGCNARAWVFVEASEDTAALPLDAFFLVTAFPGAPVDGAVLAQEDLRRFAGASYEVFEPVVAPRRRLATGCRTRSPAATLTRLVKGKDAAERLLRERIDPVVLKALHEWDGRGEPGAALVERAFDELDRLVREESFCHEKAFALHCRRGPARRALRRPVRAADYPRINRMLLESVLGEAFESESGVRFFTSHNSIVLYTWGERGCCLALGATSATLVDAGAGDVRTRVLRLRAGDFLLFEEVKGPATGREEDADPAHRHVVRLTRVMHRTDPVNHLPLLDVSWSAEDALPFSLCISVQGPAPECAWIDGVAVARGNIIVVDHGAREVDELDAVEVDAIQQPCGACQPEQTLVPRRYRPTLEQPDLTYAEPPAADASAARLMRQDLQRALPAIALKQVPVRPPILDVPDPLDRFRNPVAPTAFDNDDLASAPALLARLLKSDRDLDAVSRYLKAKLDQASLAALAAYQLPEEPVSSLRRGLIDVLNGALDDLALYDVERFPDALQDDATAALLAGQPLPPDLDRLLRRWLLEQSYPEALAPTARFVEDWTPRLDLLESSADERAFVVEMDDQRRAHLRFGDDDLGRRPEGSTRFRAFYRVGSGIAGNVGAGAISLFVMRETRLEGVALKPLNPLPAIGGTAPENLDEVRQRAPYAIRQRLARAIVAPDYASLAAREFADSLQGAAAQLTWTGSWFEADVTLDPFGREAIGYETVAAVDADLEQFRRIGHDLRVAAARYAPLAITLHVCVAPGFQQAHVLAALTDVFSSRIRKDGTRGFFHPDNLRFGQAVETSPLQAAAQRVAGVRWSRVTRLERLGDGDRGDLANGVLPIAPTEVARVDSDPGFPENGAIAFDMEGGR